MIKAIAAVIFAGLTAADVTGDGRIKLPEPASRACAAPSRCAVITEQELAAQLEQAFKAGERKAAEGCRSLI